MKAVGYTNKHSCHGGILNKTKYDNLENLMEQLVPKEKPERT